MKEVKIIELTTLPDATDLAIQNLLESHIQALEDLLSGYYFAKRGRVTVDRLVNDSWQITSSHRSGSFTVAYAVHYSLGCADQHYNDQEKMLVYFEFDRELKRLTLTGEEVYERAPDEL